MPKSLDVRCSLHYSDKEPVRSNDLYPCAVVRYCAREFYIVKIELPLFSMNGARPEYARLLIIKLQIKAPQCFTKACCRASSLLSIKADEIIVDYAHHR